MLLANFFAKVLKDLTHALAIVTGGDFEEHTTQFVGQLQAIIGCNLSGMSQVPFVAYNDNGDFSIWTDLSDVLEKGADRLVAMIVCN